MDNFLTEQEFTLFKNLIYDQSGIHFSNSNRSILESRLRERLRKINLTTIQAYHALIVRNQEEMKVLLDAVTTNLTRFFRNAAHFSGLEHYVIPEMVRHKQENNQRQIRLWSAGCSTGEEPYSLAMMLKEKLPAGVSFEVIGSDISLKSLMTAQEGFYQESRMGGIPENYLNKYFDRKHDGYQVKEEIRRLVKFDYHNLINDSGLRNIDLLFCRNVLIYFDEEAQKSAVNRFFQVMTDYSFLFIGHSESLFGLETEFQFVKTEWATFYGKFSATGRT
ncbi:MAG TPA: protein-glutamate O-methyltransferase CheR [bacterium]|nr:protein-glutamate O-methyltransferase CheR [bacterium]